MEVPATARAGPRAGGYRPAGPAYGGASRGAGPVAYARPRAKTMVQRPAIGVSVLHQKDAQAASSEAGIIKGSVGRRLELPRPKPWQSGRGGDDPGATEVAKDTDESRFNRGFFGEDRKMALQDDLHEEILEEVAMDAEDDGTRGEAGEASRSRWVPEPEAFPSGGKVYGKGDSWSRSGTTPRWSPKRGPPVPEELKEPKLFVSGLPAGTTEAELQDHFEELFGDVKEVAFIYHPETKALRFGFVVFDRLEVAQAVLQNYKWNWFRDQWIDCRAAGQAPRGVKRKAPEPAAAVKTKGSQLLVEGIPLANWQDKAGQAELLEYLEWFGPVTEVKFTDNGVAEVTFEFPDTAETASQQTAAFNGKTLHLSVLRCANAPKRTLPPAPAAEQGDKDDEITNQVIFETPPQDWTEETARTYCSKFGDVTELKLVGNGVLVTYSTCESAAKAIAFAKVGGPKPFFAPKVEVKEHQDHAEPEEEADPEDVFLYVQNQGIGQMNASDVFKVFGKYSLARIRDLDGEAVVEFNTRSECLKAFEEKNKTRLPGLQLWLSGATRDDFLAFKARQEQRWGGSRPPGR